MTRKQVGYSNKDQQSIRPRIAVIKIRDQDPLVVSTVLRKIADKIAKGVIAAPITVNGVDVGRYSLDYLAERDHPQSPIDWL